MFYITCPLFRLLALYPLLLLSLSLPFLRVDVPSEHRNCNDKLVSKAKKQFSGLAALAIFTLRYWKVGFLVKIGTCLKKARFWNSVRKMARFLFPPYKAKKTGHKSALPILAWENSRHLATLPLVSPPNDVWETSAEIRYWWLVTTQIWV